LKVNQEATAVPYPKDAPPVFFGHYWIKGIYPVTQTTNVACLDYSIAKDGILTAYRWNGEKKITNEQFAFV
jgi:hypothetical protein